MDIDPNSILIKNNLPRLKKILSDDNIRVWFVASPFLRALIAKDDPQIKDMPIVFKQMLLSGDGVIIQKIMILKYLEGTLDSRNSFILTNGDVRITMQNDNVLTGITREVTKIEQILERKL